MAEPTTKLTLRLTDRSREGWRRCTDGAGITLNALAEAIGLALLEGRFEHDDELIERARRIDAERRNRR